jgi:hypothetical protein
MLLDSSGMLLAELTGMLSRLVSMLPVSKGMLLPVGMSLAEVAGMLRKSSVLLALPSLLPLTGMLPLRGMLPASVFAMLKNSASAAFIPAEYIKPFLDISPFCSQKAISACSTAGPR